MKLVKNRYYDCYNVTTPCTPSFITHNLYRVGIMFHHSIRSLKFKVVVVDIILTLVDRNTLGYG